MGQIFVYGSLMQNFFNYNKYLDGKVLKVEKAYIKGKLYHLENKGYPGYVPEGDDTVYGEIVTIEDYERVLEALDQLEGYKAGHSEGNMYNRKFMQVISLEDCQDYSLGVYVYNAEAECNCDDTRLYLEHGSWRQHMNQL